MVPAVIRNHRDVLIVVLLALAIRLAFLLPVHTLGYTSDEREYVSIARQLAQGMEFVDSNGERSTRAPLYPLVLAGIFSVSGGSVRLAECAGCVLGALIVLLVFLVGKDVLGDRQAALWAAALAAVYPGLVIYSGMLQTETLYTVLLLLSVWMACRLASSSNHAASFVLGCICGAAALTRAVFLGFFPFLVALLWSKSRSNGQPAVRGVVLCVLGFCLVLAPWTARNYALYRELVPVSSGGGNALLAGNNPYATGTWRMQPGFEQWYEQEARLLGVENTKALSEPEKGKLSGEIARRYIVSHPGEVVSLMLKKAHIFFVYPITNTDSAISVQGLAVIFDLLMLLLAMVGLVALRPKGNLSFVVLPLVVFAAIQLSLHAEARFRLPLIPLLSLFSGVGVATLNDRDRIGGLSSRPGRRRALLLLISAVVVIYFFTGLLFLKGAL